MTVRLTLAVDTAGGSTYGPGPWCECPFIGGDDYDGRGFVWTCAHPKADEAAQRGTGALCALPDTGVIVEAE